MWYAPAFPAAIQGARVTPARRCGGRGSLLLRFVGVKESLLQELVGGGRYPRHAPARSCGGEKSLGFLLQGVRGIPGIPHARDGESLL